MAVVLTFAGGKPVVKVGRIAGQFAKPRSEPIETIDGVTLPSYRGDNINGQDFDRRAAGARPRAAAEGLRPVGLDPEPAARLRRRGGYADLYNVHRWTLGFVADSPQGARYRELADKISADARLHGGHRPDAGEPPDPAPGRVLHQPRGPAAGLRGGADPRRFHHRATGTTPRPTCCGSASARASSTARHIEFLQGIKNPIGMKVGPTLEPDELLRLIDALNPDNEAGRLTLYGRFGATRSTAACPRLMAATKREGKQVVWATDPMHGNTLTGLHRLQDPAVRPDPGRGAAASSRWPTRRACTRAASTWK